MLVSLFLATALANPVVDVLDPVEATVTSADAPVQWKLDAPPEVAGTAAWRGGVRGPQWEIDWNVEEGVLTATPVEPLPGPGTWSVPVRLSWKLGKENDPNPREHNEDLLLSVTLPPAVLEAPGSLRLEVDASGMEFEPGKWTATATPGGGPLAGLGVRHAISPAVRADRQVDGLQLELGASALEPGAAVDLVPVGLETLEIGKTTGSVVLAAPSLETDTVVPYEVHKRRSWLWLLPVIATGLLISWLLRTVLVRYAQRAKAREALEALKEALHDDQALIADSRFLDETEALIDELDRAMGGLSAGAMKTVLDSSTTKRTQLLAAVEGRGTTVAAGLDAFESLVRAPALDLPAEVRAELGRIADPPSLRAELERRAYHQLGELIEDRQTALVEAVAERLRDWHQRVAFMLDKAGQTPLLADAEVDAVKNTFAGAGAGDLGAILARFDATRAALRVALTEASIALTRRVDGAQSKAPQLQEKLAPLAEPPSDDVAPEVALELAAARYRTLIALLEEHASHPEQVEDAVASESWADLEGAMGGPGFEARFDASGTAWPTPDLRLWDRPPAPPSAPAAGRGTARLPRLVPTSVVVETASTLITLALVALWMAWSLYSESYYGTGGELIVAFFGAFGADVTLGALVKQTATLVPGTP